MNQHLMRTATRSRCGLTKDVDFVTVYVSPRADTFRDHYCRACQEDLVREFARKGVDIR